MEKSLSIYQRGNTPFFACRADQRFSYCLYVPESFARDKNAPLVVIVHGTGRMVCEYRNAYTDFAEKTGSVILLPLFPAGIIDPLDLHNYKRILYKDIRYDLILLSMVKEAGENLGTTWDKFYLQGFSGGGQFVHRFFYLHPQRLNAVSIGAPGNVTLLDDDRFWWVGGGDFKEKFGWSPDISAMSQVAVHMIVGQQDTDTWEITFQPDWPTWVEGANDAGKTRIDRLKRLAQSLEGFGLHPTFETVPGLGHDGMGVISYVQKFFLENGLSPRQFDSTSRIVPNGSK